MNVSTTPYIPSYQFTVPEGRIPNTDQQVRKDSDPATSNNGNGQTSRPDRAKGDPSPHSHSDTKAQAGSQPGGQKAMDGHELSAEEIRQVEELRARDREVHAHEQAHIAAGGRYVRSGASYHYQTGPDGKKYAIGGEVSIDTSEERDPKATIRKMEVVRKAALAPARPSAQDRSVAAQASRKMAEAAAELAKMQAQGKEEQASDTVNTNSKAATQETSASIMTKGRVDIYA